MTPKTEMDDLPCCQLMGITPTHLNSFTQIRSCLSIYFLLKVFLVRKG